MKSGAHYKTDDESFHVEKRGQIRELVLRIFFEIFTFEFMQYKALHSKIPGNKPVHVICICIFQHNILGSQEEYYVLLKSPWAKRYA